MGGSDLYAGVGMGVARGEDLWEAKRREGFLISLWINYLGLMSYLGWGW